METIIDALKAMGKASSIEIAARLDMDRQEVINQLWELKEAEVVKKDGHYWELATGNALGHVGEAETKPVSIKAEDLINIIAEKGPMTAEELAVVAGVTARRVASSLAMATSRGKVLRQPVGGKFRYMVASAEAIPVKADSEKIAAPAPVPESVMFDAVGELQQVGSDENKIEPTPVGARGIDIESHCEKPECENLEVPTIAHLRQRIKQQKAGARRDEQLLKHLIRVHRLLEVSNG
ncbi:DUF1627 domain-containing protein [Serratia fonticola]